MRSTIGRHNATFVSLLSNADIEARGGSFFTYFTGAVVVQEGLVCPSVARPCVHRGCHVGRLLIDIDASVRARQVDPARTFTVRRNAIEEPRPTLLRIGGIACGKVSCSHHGSGGTWPTARRHRCGELFSEIVAGVVGSFGFALNVHSLLARRPDSELHSTTRTAVPAVGVPLPHLA